MTMACWARGEGRCSTVTDPLGTSRSVRVIAADTFADACVGSTAVEPEELELSTLEASREE